MRYKKFQSSDVEVSELGVGTWAIGGENYGSVDREESIEAINKMIDRGVNLIDTAPSYGNGQSEKIIGEAIKGKRDKVLLSTKFGYIPDFFKGGIRDTSFKNIIREIQSSLYNLGTDYIDFYFIHWPDLNTPIEETMSALNYLKKQGVIRFIGVSNFSKEQIIEAEKYGKIDVQQPPFSMVNQTSRELIEWGYSAGIETFSYGSMGAGILSGAIRKIPNFAPNDNRLTFYDFFEEPKFSKCMELVKTLDEIAEIRQKPVTQVTINWSTQKKFLTTALVGVRNAGQADENCDAFDWKLTNEEILKIDEQIAALNLEKQSDNYE